MTLEEFGRSMLNFAKGQSNWCALNNMDFTPTFVILKDGTISPTPFPHYTKDREFHIATMKAMIQDADADAFAFLMEAWFTQPPLKKGKLVDPRDYPRPAECTDRKECLVAHCATRDGQETMLVVEIKRHGHKLTYSEPTDMMDKKEGRGAMTAMSNMFGAETIN